MTYDRPRRLILLVSPRYEREEAKEYVISHAADPLASSK